MEAAGSSEKLEPIYQNMQTNIPEDSNPHTDYSRGLKSQPCSHLQINIPQIFPSNLNLKCTELTEVNQVHLQAKQKEK
jgi:hypothetical protein